MKRNLIAGLTAALMLLTTPAALAAGGPSLSCQMQEGRTALSLTVNQLDADAPVYALQLEIPLSAGGTLTFYPDEALGPDTGSLYYKLDTRTENGGQTAILYLDSTVPINLESDVALGSLVSDGTLTPGTRARMIVVKGQLEGVTYEDVVLTSSGGGGGPDDPDDGPDDDNGGGNSSSSGGSSGGGGSTYHGGSASRPADPVQKAGAALSLSADEGGSITLSAAALAGAASLEVRGDAVLSLDGTALYALQSAGADVAVRAGRLPKAELSPAVRAQLGRAELYDIALTAAGAPLDLSGGAMRVTVPFAGKGRPVAVLVEEGGVTRLGETRLEEGKAVFTLSSGGRVAVLDVTHAFTDVDGWYEGYVNAVSASGIMTGVSAESFQPGRVMTRAELVTALHRLAGSPAAERPAGFADVPADAWYASAVAWAAESGVTSGVSETAFDPQGSVTREQMATLFARFASLRGIALEPIREPAAFADGEQISPFARESVDLMQRAGMLNGRDGGRFDPQGTATRAECAKLLALINRAV